MLSSPSSSSSAQQPLLDDSNNEKKDSSGIDNPLAAVHVNIAADAPPPIAPQGKVEDHILEPNATNLAELVDAINYNSNSSAVTNALCCVTGALGCFHLLSGRVFSTEIGKIDLWLDSNKRPQAYLSNKWHIVANLMHRHLGTYDMSSAQPYQQSGVCITKIEAGRVVFANKGGQPVMIVAKNNKTGWYVSTEPGFSFADKITVNNALVNTNTASISEDYIKFESLHLFNVQPNTICVLSKTGEDGDRNEFSILMPGPHSYNSPYMRFLATIPTSVQDEIIVESSISTQDGVVLSRCNAVLSYRVKIEEAQNLLMLDVSKYNTVIKDWAKRTMLHEIGNTNYQGYRQTEPMEGSTPPTPSHSHQFSSIIGSHFDDIGEEGKPFRPTLEHKMQEALKKKLQYYGVEIVTFSLQSFEPPRAIAEQVTTAIAKRTEAEYAFQAQKVNNYTIIARAEAEAKAINIDAQANVDAAKLMEKSPFAQRLKIADKQAKIASAWTSGNARTLFFGAPTHSALPLTHVVNDADEPQVDRSNARRY